MSRDDEGLEPKDREISDDVASLPIEVVSAVDADPALRARARFHLGRLHYERGDHAAAREQLAAVLAATPDHRRARGYLDAMDRAAGAGVA